MLFRSTTPRMKGYKISAIFEVGMSEYDTSIVYMPFSEAQLYFNMDGRAQTIEIYVDNPDDVDALKPKVEEAAQRPIDMVDWRQRNETFFSALQVERNVMFMIPAVSSTDSVVWVTKPSACGSAGSSLAASASVSTSVTAPSGNWPIVPITSGCPAWPINSTWRPSR